MRAQRFWAAVVASDAYEAERLYANETLAIELGQAAGKPRPGDLVAMVAAGDPPVLFGLGVVATSEAGTAAVRYTHRAFDDPKPVGGTLAVGLAALTEAEYGQLSTGIGAQQRVDRDRSEWFVSVALPIEAPSRAEAVREFWSYIDKLGPRELPAFVWPRGDELAMHAYVLGDETTLDPEEDDD